MNEDIFLTIFSVCIYVFVMTLFGARVAPYFRTMLDLLQARKEKRERERRKKDVWELRHRSKVRSARIILQMSKERRLRKERSQRSPVQRYEDAVSDEVLYAPNLGHIDDGCVPVVADDVNDVYRGLS